MNFWIHKAFLDERMSPERIFVPFISMPQSLPVKTRGMVRKLALTTLQPLIYFTFIYWKITNRISCVRWQRGEGVDHIEHRAEIILTSMGFKQPAVRNSAFCLWLKVKNILLALWWHDNVQWKFIQHKGVAFVFRRQWQQQTSPQQVLGSFWW